MELSAVIFLMMLFLGLALPNFSNLVESSPMIAAKTLGTMIRQLKIESISKGKNRILQLHPEEKKYDLFIQEGNQLQRHPKYQQSQFFSTDVSIVALSTGNNNEISLYSSDPISIRISSEGFVDIFTITFQQLEERVSLQIVNILGKINITKNHEE